MSRTRLRKDIRKCLMWQAFYVAAGLAGPFGAGHFMGEEPRVDMSAPQYAGPNSDAFKGEALEKAQSNLYGLAVLSILGSAGAALGFHLVGRKREELNIQFNWMKQGSDTSSPAKLALLVPHTTEDAASIDQMAAEIEASMSADADGVLSDDSKVNRDNVVTLEVVSTRLENV